MLEIGVVCYDHSVSMLLDPVLSPMKLPLTSTLQMTVRVDRFDCCPINCILIVMTLCLSS